MTKISRLLILLFILLTSCSSGPDNSEMVQYKSAFGFTSRISDSWIAITKSSIENEKINLKKEKFKKFDSGYIKSLETSTISGRVETLLYLNKKYDYNDHINIIVSVGNLLKKKQEKHFCEKMPDAFRKILGKEVVFFDCGLKKKGTMDFLYLNYEGAMKNTRSAQYQFQVSPGRVIIVTLTCSNKSYDKLNRDFEKFITGIRLGKE